MNQTHRLQEKIENEKAEGVLIVAMFKTQTWFPNQIKLLIRMPVKPKATCKSLYFIHS